MAKIKILAGNFDGSYLAEHSFSSGKFHLVKDDGMQSRNGWKETIYDAKSDIKSIQQADEQAGVKVFGAAGWGVVGAVLAGPAGLLAGAILGGRGKKVIFIAEFNDGKKIMAECKGGVWTKIMAASMFGESDKELIAKIKKRLGG